MIRFFSFLVIICVVCQGLCGCADESESKTTTEFVEAEASAIPEAEFITETLESMQGIWVATENTRKTIQITKNIFREKVPGQPENIAEIEAYLNCPNYCSDGKVSVASLTCFVLKKNNTAECFTIIKLTEEELQFTRMAGKPEIRAFKRR